MSMFLPEGFGQTQQQDVVASVTPANPETTQEDIALMQRVLSAAMRNPNLIPSDFMSYIVDYIQTSRLIIPIGQVFGFSQSSAKIASGVYTLESTTSATYADLATVGPQLTGLPDGKYLIVFGWEIHTVGATGYCTVNVNGTDGPDGPTPGGSSRQFYINISDSTLSAGTNTVTMKYRSATGGTSVDFLNRIMFVLKYA